MKFRRNNGTLHDFSCKVPLEKIVIFAGGIFGFLLYFFCCSWEIHDRFSQWTYCGEITVPVPLQNDAGQEPQSYVSVEFQQSVPANRSGRGNLLQTPDAELSRMFFSGGTVAASGKWAVSEQTTIFLYVKMSSAILERAGPDFGYLT